jgi:hypothetical protein
MWKILVAFIVFAAIALTVVFKMGDKADLAGEAGGHTEPHSSSPAAPATPATPAAADNAAQPATAPVTAPATAEEKK